MAFQCQLDNLATETLRLPEDEQWKLKATKVKEVELGSGVFVREKEQEKKSEFTGERQNGDRKEYNRNTPPEKYISRDRTSIRVNFEVDGEINKDQS